MPSERIIRSFPNGAALERAAAEMFVQKAREAIAARGIFVVALAGGSTPRRLYALLADEGDVFRAQLAWDRIHFFWGDERHVPPDHADSNFRMANEAMLARVPIPPQNVHRIFAENPDAAQAAQLYEEEIAGCLGRNDAKFPRLDLVLLGMGPDGHTASLFPGTTALKEDSRWVVSNWVEKFQTDRITMTAPMLNHGGCIVFLVQGGEKAEVLRNVLFGERNTELYPSQLIQAVEGECYWLVDQPAAERLPSTGR